jgi:hypothetical protein
MQQCLQLLVLVVVVVRPTVLLAGAAGRLRCPPQLSGVG